MKPHPPITFVLHALARQTRRHPFVVDWRSLPYHLLETPIGGRWQVELEDGTTREVGVGQMLFVPADTRHRLTMTSRESMESIWCLVSWQIADGPDVLSGRAMPAQLADGAKLQELAGLAEEETLRATARLHGLGFGILEGVADKFDLDAVPTRQERFFPVFQYVNRHLSGPITRRDLATLVSLSETRFHTVFKEATGCAPMEYVMQARLKRARELLLTRDLPIGEIAERCGFGSVYYFSRCFRQKLGTTPSAYRKLGQHGEGKLAEREGFEPSVP